MPGATLILKLTGDINLLAAQNTATQNSTNSNSGWSVGIGFTVGGQQNGFTLDLAANKGQGKSDGDDVTQSNTRIKAGNVATLESGGDTSLKGAEVIADQVKATVGGDLNIESLQDTSEYSSKQVSASVGVSLCLPPVCAGTSGSASFNQQKMQSEYASVSQQSGIKAGDGGFQVDVKGNTGLVGAVIASSDQAVIDGKNTLSTGTLTSSDIKNKAEYDASSIGLSASVGIAGRDGDGKQKAGAPGQPVATTGENKVSANAPIILLASGESKSITQSGISGAAITIKDETKQQALTGQTAEQTIATINTNVSSDRDGSNKLKPIFDANEIQTNFNIVGTFVQNVGVFLEDRAREVDNKKTSAEKALADSRDPTRSDEDRQASRDAYLILRQEAKDIANDWGAGGTYRQIATALVAGISGNVTGASSQFAQNMVINYVQQQGSAAIGDLVVKGLKEGSPEHAALHAILGCAGAAASNQSCSAGAMGGAASSVLTRLFSEVSPNETDAEREAKRNIITSLVAGIAFVSDPSSASAATNAATANVDNNWLATQQLVQAKKEYELAVGWQEKGKVIAKWGTISTRQDFLTSTSIGLGIAEGGWNDVEGVYEFMLHPIDGLQGLASVVTSSDVRDKIGNDAVESLLASIDRITLAMETGGDEQAAQLGRDLGLLLYTVGSIVTGVGGAAKAGATLGKVGVNVSSKALGTLAAKDGAALSESIAKLETNTAKNLNSAPVVPSAKGPASGLPSGETKVVADGTQAANDASFTGAKGPASDLPSGETKVVGSGTQAANDASFTGTKGPASDLPSGETKVVADGTQAANDAEGYFIPPGMDRPFRAVNPMFPANQAVVDAMNSPQIKNMVSCTGTDCSDIASKLFAASGNKGTVVEVSPSSKGELNVFENGKIESSQWYHQVYTDGQYVYDPRLSSSPVPKGDWEQHIKNINPDGVFISDKLKGLR